MHEGSLTLAGASCSDSEAVSDLETGLVTLDDLVAAVLGFDLVLEIWTTVSLAQILIPTGSTSESVSWAIAFFAVFFGA